MAESNELLCEPCNFKNITKSASMWCTECDDGLCDECCMSHKAHKISRNHHIIPAEYYQNTKILNVKLECSEHSKQCDFYCLSHDSMACVVCLQSKHGGCEDLRPLNEAAKDAKTSTAFTDLEQTIDGLLQNIENGERHLQQNETSLKKQEEVIKKSISTKRAQINKHLDHLEDKLLKELKSKAETAIKEIVLITNKFETKRKNISVLKDTAQNMKVFVGIRSILKTVVNEINGIKLLVNSIPQLSIAVQINPKFDTITAAFNSLGKIKITSEAAVVPYVERRLIQAQFQRQAEAPVHKLQLKLRTNIKMGENNLFVTSCLILPNKSVMIASWNKPSLIILKEDGSHDRDISVSFETSLHISQI